MFKSCQFDRSVILLCVRWYLAYGLSLRDLEEMMADRSISVDHSTIHRWVVRFSPVLLKSLVFISLLVGAFAASYMATVGGRIRDDLPATS